MENSALPDKIWLIFGTKYEGFELLREGAQPVVDLYSVPSHLEQEELDDGLANITAHTAIPT